MKNQIQFDNINFSNPANILASKDEENIKKG